MKLLIILPAAVLSLFSVGCTHMHKVSAVSQRTVLPQGYRVKIGDLEAKEGDIFDVNKKVCKELTSRIENQTKCELKKVGQAEIIKILDEDSAIVASKAGLYMDESMELTHVKTKN